MFNLFTMNSFFKSFGFAYLGVVHLIKNERNFKIQFYLFMLILFFAFYFQISKMEWISVLICASSVLSLEAVNTSIERICNEMEPNFNPKIKIIKDTAAGAVLITSIFSSVIGILIFLPYVYRLVANL